jgi:hypothetical protein
MTADPLRLDDPVEPADRDEGGLFQCTGPRPPRTGVGKSVTLNYSLQNHQPPTR